MIFKILAPPLLPRSVQTPNSDKNWQTSCPLQTSVCNISRHLEFIIVQDHQVNWVSGSLDSRVTGSLGHKMWPSSMSGVRYITTSKHHSFAWQFLRNGTESVCLSVCLSPLQPVSGTTADIDRLPLAPERSAGSVMSWSHGGGSAQTCLFLLLFYTYACELNLIMSMNIGHLLVQPQFSSFTCSIGKCLLDPWRIT